MTSPSQDLIRSLISYEIAYEQAHEERKAAVKRLQAEGQAVAERLSRLLPEGMYFWFDDAGFREREPSAG